MSSLKNALLAALVLFFASAAQAETYYIAPNGKAAWNQCTNSATPCSGRTAAINARAGDLVYFRDGSYYPHSDPVSKYYRGASVIPQSQWPSCSTILLNDKSYHPLNFLSTAKLIIQQSGEIDDSLRSI